MARIWHCCGSDIGQQLTALIRLLGWEPPYAVGAALGKTKDNKQTLSLDVYVFFRIFDWDSGQKSDMLLSALNMLCELGQGTTLLWASVSPSIEQEGQTGDF